MCGAGIPWLSVADPVKTDFFPIIPQKGSCPNVLNSIFKTAFLRYNSHTIKLNGFEYIPRIVHQSPLSLEHFHPPQKKAITLHSTSPSTPVIHLSILCLCGFTCSEHFIYRESYMKSYNVTFSIWFLSLSMFTRFLHVAACVSTHSFLFLNHNPLYGYTTFCLLIHP